MTTTLATPNILNSFTRLFVLPFMAFFFAFAGTQAITTTPAEAGVGKKLKFGKKVFGKVEKAGRKLSKKKGIVGKIGKGMQKGGRAGRKGTGKALRVAKKAKGIANKQLSKSKAGRAVLKGGKAYKKARKNTLNKAFKKCKHQACQDVKEGVDAYIPG